MASLFGDSTNIEEPGVKGEYKGMDGGSGVLGVSVAGHGVRGNSTTNQATTIFLVNKTSNERNIHANSFN